MGIKIDRITKKTVKQAMTATQMADRLDLSLPGPSNRKERATTPPCEGTKVGASPNKKPATQMRMAKQNPEDLKSFRPPLKQAGTAKEGREVEAPKEKREFIQGISGAGYKWYDRYRKEGNTHEEALERVKSRPKVAQIPQKAKPKPRALAPGKREISRESPQEAAKKRAKTTHTGGTRQALIPKKHAQTGPVPKCTEPVDYAKVRVIPVGIIPRGYPATCMSKDELKSVQSYISSKVHLGWKTLIRLAAIHYKAGYLVVDCWDEDTAEWLSAVIKEHPETLGTELRTVRGDDLPQEALVTIFLPNAAALEENTILKTIQASNPVDTETWHMISCHPSGSGRLLKAAISPPEQRKIVGLNYKIHFLFGQTEVCGLRKGNNTEGQVPKEQNPTIETGPPVSVETNSPKNAAVGDSEEERLLEEVMDVPEATDSDTLP